MKKRTKNKLLFFFIDSYSVLKSQEKNLKIIEHFIFIVVILFMSFKMIGQNNDIVSQIEFDSIVAPHQMFRENPFEYWHKPKEYGVDPVKIKKMLNDNSNLKGWHVYYSRLAHVNFMKNNAYRDSIIYYAKKSIESYAKNKEDLKSWDQETLMFYLISSLERTYERNVNKSIKSMMKALDLAKEYNLKNWIGICYSGIGKNQYQVGNDSIALEYYLKTAADSSFMSNPRAYTSTHGTIANIYFGMEKYSQSKKYVKNGLKVSFESDYKKNIFPLYGLLGNIYHIEKKEDSMRLYFRKSIEHYENFGSNNPRLVSHGKVLYKMYKSYFKIEDGALEEAIIDLDSILDYHQGSEIIQQYDKDVLLLTISILAKAYEKQGDFKKYSKIIDLTNTTLDRFQKYKLEEKLENLEIQYQTSEKDKSIAQLEINQKQQESIILQQRIISFGLVGLLLLLLGLAFLFWRQRKLKNLIEKESLEQQLLRAQMNPHFTFNTLSRIQNMIDANPEQAKNYLVKFSRLLVSIFESSTSNYISLEKELKSLNEYVELQRIHFPKDFEFYITLNEIDPEVLFVPGMLLQPIIENSLKHGFIGINHPLKISLELKKQKSFISCSVEDNGRGLSDSYLAKEIPSSTQLISNFLSKVTKRKYTILNKKDTFEKQTGVIVNFSIPYKLSLND